MKPLKERLDEAAEDRTKYYAPDHIKLFSQMDFKAGAKWMQAEMQKEIDELVEALEFYVYLKGDLNEVYTATVGLKALAKHKERMR
jgi:hypothetical protein